MFTLQAALPDSPMAHELPAVGTAPIPGGLIFEPPDSAYQFRRVRPQPSKQTMAVTELAGTSGVGTPV
jgi:hypothetical protein